MPEEVGLHPAGASIYGVEDMVGNALEAILDWYDEDAYRECGDPCINPVGPLSGESRMLRGASSWGKGRREGRYWRVDRRGTTYPECCPGEEDVGFRCVYEELYE
jgi:formylglycine-generating enzyme required for sulfatase activity